MIALVFLAALFLLVAYIVIRKAVFHAILDADVARAQDARDARRANEPLPDAPKS
ncbi:hypothetical protein [Nocardioides guangzhouensis]|uniref:hypothetical protein n=1 Tax=Nocardioides guangzhouensis TaxID=2497878 RepID=UPI0014385496|nr:hypothetical protein [Nocardioides guangzhouensis]